MSFADALYCAFTVGAVIPQRELSTGLTSREIMS
jgi:hypothetical protein